MCIMLQLISAQFSSFAQSCPTLCDPTNHSTPGLPVHHQLLEFTQTHAHWVGDAIQSSHPLSSPSSPSIFPSIRVFSNESALRIRWPKYWSFSFNISFNISPSNEHSRLISFRMNWLDLLAVQGTLKSLKWKWSRSVVSDSLQPRELGPTRLLHLWDFPGKSIGVGCHCLLQLPSAIAFSRVLLSHKKRLLTFNLTQRMSIRIEGFAHAVPKPRMFCYNSNPIHSSLLI